MGVEVWKSVGGGGSVEGCSMEVGVWRGVGVGVEV